MTGGFAPDARPRAGLHARIHAFSLGSVVVLMPHRRHGNIPHGAPATMR
jgi:hypothetical protein